MKTARHDWTRFDALTDADVHAAALVDPDAQPLTESDTAGRNRVPRAKTLRRALGLTQEEFAARYQIPLGTLRDWEQGRTQPDQPARAYLKAISGDPVAVQLALRASENTANLKFPIWPTHAEFGAVGELTNVPELNSRILQRNNKPRSNSNLADRTGKYSVKIPDELTQAKRRQHDRRRWNERCLKSPIRRNIWTDLQFNGRKETFSCPVVEGNIPTTAHSRPTLLTFSALHKPINPLIGKANITSLNEIALVVSQ